MKFYEMPQWIEVKKGLAAECVFDEETVAKIGEQKSDSPNLAEMMMSLEEAFPKLRKGQR